MSKTIINKELNFKFDYNDEYNVINHKDFEAYDFSEGTLEVIYTDDEEERVISFNRDSSFKTKKEYDDIILANKNNLEDVGAEILTQSKVNNKKGRTFDKLVIELFGDISVIHFTVVHNTVICFTTDIEIEDDLDIIIDSLEEI